MNCSRFLARFSEYYDGLMAPEERARAEAHVRGCDACRRYRDVVEEGVERLRSLAPVGVDDDFRDRVRERLVFESGSGRSVDAPSDASGASLAAAVGLAALLVAVAWSPSLRDSVPEVRMPAIVVSEPAPAARPSLSVPPAVFFRIRARRTFEDPALLRNPTSLLYEYSALQRRYPAATGLRGGLD